MFKRITEIIDVLEESHRICRMRNLEDDSPFEKSFFAGQIHAYGVCLHILRRVMKEYAHEVPVMPLELMEFMTAPDL